MLSKGTFAYRRHGSKNSTQHAIAGGLDDAAKVRGDFRIDELAA
jgi:hypothetical protein